MPLSEERIRSAYPPGIFDPTAQLEDGAGNVRSFLPYLADERAFALSMFIHETMHPFGAHANFDHFGTAACDTAMGGTDYKAGAKTTSKHHRGLCRNVYESFAASYSACP